MLKFVLILALASAGWAQEKKPLATGAGGDRKVAIEATAYYTREQTKEFLGHDPGENVVVVAVKLRPAQGEPLRLNREDFLLRTDGSGGVSRPQEPAQIAGTTAMVVKSVAGGAGRPMSEQRRIPIGVPGVPGSGGSIPVPNEAPGVGSATADTSVAQATFEKGKEEKKANPLLEVLQARQLAEGEYDEPVTGLLYFQLEGKLKPRDLELVYRRSPPRVSVRFTEPGKPPKKN